MAHTPLQNGLFHCCIPLDKQSTGTGIAGTQTGTGGRHWGFSCHTIPWGLWGNITVVGVAWR